MMDNLIQQTQELNKLTELNKLSLPKDLKFERGGSKIYDGLSGRRKMRLHMPRMETYMNETSINQKSMNGDNARALKSYYGCITCPHKGTQRCVEIQQSAYDDPEHPEYDTTILPVEMIKKGEKHKKGICIGRIKEVMAHFKLMGRPDGMRLLRNKNILRLQDYTDGLYDRLIGVKNETGALTDDEKGLLYMYHQLTMELNRRFESALKQDEGTKIEVTKLTPSQINELIADSGEKIKRLEEKKNALDIEEVSESGIDVK